MKKLTRSTNNKIIFGVLGGISDFFGIDATLVRLLYIFLVFVSSSSLLLVYIIASIIIPKDTTIYHNKYDDSIPDTSNFYLGIGLIILGVILTIEVTLSRYNITLINEIKRILRQITSFWPVLLIGLGIFILSKSREEER